MRIEQRPSPNFDARPYGTPVDILVLHYTGMRTAEEALTRLCDPAAKVSAHYTIDREGRVYRHVDERVRAWHAGVSWWAGEANVNARSIGIELVNPGHEFDYIPFTEDQIAALIDLSRGIVSRWPIPPQRVLGHSDVAPARKQDPGELFPWKCLAEYGLGIWPNLLPPPRGEVARASARVGGDASESFTAALARFGYGLPPDTDVALKDVVTAFQRHFRPSCVDGNADNETKAVLSALLSA